MGSGATNQPKSKKNESLSQSEQQSQEQKEQVVNEKEDESQIDENSGDWNPILKFFIFTEKDSRS